MATITEQKYHSARQGSILASMTAPTIASLIFFAVAFVFGGGGSRFAMAEMVVYLSALPALFFVVSAAPENQEFGHSRTAKAFIVALITLVLLQIIPLPPFIWQSLPGRETLAEAAMLIGEENSWRPLSIDPDATVSSALYMLVPITAFLCVSSMDDQQLRLLIICLVTAATLHLLVAMAQAASGGESFYLYSTTHKGLPLGLFANRNHTTIFFLATMILSASLIADNIRSASFARQILYSCVVLALLIAILATSSRAATILAALSILFLGLVSIKPRFRKIGFIAVGAIAALSAFGLFTAWSSGNLGSLAGLAERFQQSDDHRYEFWPDTLVTLAHYFPFGSGIGTFNEAFRSQESLEIVGTHYVNHAHNDYIELAIETGIFGLGLGMVLLIILAYSAYRILHSYARSILPDLPVLAVWMLLMIAMHSMVDYPLRSLSIAALFGGLIAICMRSAAIDRRKSG